MDHLPFGLVEKFGLSGFSDNDLKEISPMISNHELHSSISVKKGK